MATYNFPEYVAWMGHVSTAGAERAGYSADEIASAIADGLVEPVARLGGWVASRKGNARQFGEGFNALIDGLVG